MKKCEFGEGLIEGIVWHKPDGQMFKIKAKDFKADTRLQTDRTYMKMKLKNLTNKISKSKIKVVGLKEASGFISFQWFMGS